MTVTVDTSAWIEWLTDGPLAAEVGKALPSREERLVPTIVQLELAKWLVRERSEEIADTVVGYTQKCAVIELDTEIALLAASLCKEHGLATADAIVYATALSRDSTLLTCDAHFAGLERVVYIPKRG